MAALENHQFLPRIKDDFMGGVRRGVNGTPAFFINGERYEESWEFQNLVAAIEQYLSLGKTGRRRAG